MAHVRMKSFGFESKVDATESAEECLECGGLDIASIRLKFKGNRQGECKVRAVVEGPPAQIKELSDRLQHLAHRLL